MLKAYVVGLLLGLSLLIVAVVTSSQIQQKGTEPLEDEIKLYQAELVDATPVQRGVLTEQARLHSKYYSYYGTPRNIQRLSELIEKVKGKTKVVNRIVGLGLTEVLEPETPERYFGSLSRTSDTVIRGKVVSKVSHITEDDYFILTDYDTVVLEVIKNNQTVPINKDRTITVVRPGGKVSLDGMVVGATDDAFLPLPVNQGEVLLFLKFIPETGAYQTTRSTGAFQLQEEALYPLTGDSYPPGVLQDKKSFLNTVRVVSK